MANSLLLIGLAVCAQAAQPARDLASTASQLVKQLNDTAVANRDAAEKALVELGPDVLVHFPPITPRTPAEIKERLGRVRSVLETKLSESTSQPTMVSLMGEMPFVEAMDRLQKLTGNRVGGYDRRRVTTNVKASFEGTTYWKALDDLLDQAKFNINPYGGEASTLVLVARPENEAARVGSACYSGVFRFEVLRVEARRDLRIPATNGMRLTLNVTWEPRITPISLRQPIDAVTILDGDGMPLSLSQGENQPVLNASGEVGMSAIELGIPMQLPNRNISKISVLKGTLTALVPGRLEAFEFSDLETARDAEQQRAGVTVTFERLRQNGDLYEVRLRVRYSEAANALESHRSWIFTNPAYMLDAKGQRIENLGSNEGGRDENEIGIVCLFDLPKGPKGCKFVYQTPTSLLQLPVAYELKDILLP